MNIIKKIGDVVANGTIVLGAVVALGSVAMNVNEVANAPENEEITKTENVSFEDLNVQEHNGKQVVIAEGMEVTAIVGKVERLEDDGFYVTNIHDENDQVFPYYEMVEDGKEVKEGDIVKVTFYGDWIEKVEVE